MSTVKFQDLLDWGFTDTKVTTLQLEMFEKERKQFLNEEWDRIHANDRPYEPDWDIVSLEFEQYTDKIITNGA